MKLFGLRSLRTLSKVTKEATSGMQGDGSSHDVMPPEQELDEMSFLEHLEELRWTIFRALGGILIVTIVCSFFSKWIIDELLMGPSQSDFFMYQWLGIEAESVKFQNRVLTGQFFVHIGAILSISKLTLAKSSMKQRI